MICLCQIYITEDVKKKDFFKKGIVCLVIQALRGVLMKGSTLLRNVGVGRIWCLLLKFLSQHNVLIVL